MKKIIFLISIIFSIIVGCSDDINKNAKIQPRIEYSDCSSCMKCIDEFHCPENAIKYDESHLTAYIDVDKCTQCMKCIDEFSCEDNAFKTDVDTHKPANFTDFTAVSDSAGYANISFTAPGDDENSGRIYSYDLKIYQENQIIPYNYEFNYPVSANQKEHWNIGNLPEGKLLTVKLQAFDEANNSNEIATTTVIIKANEIDEIAPATITNFKAQALTEAILLSWTSVGDDGTQGTADHYIIKKNSVEITNDNWDESTEIPQTINPAVSGNQELFLLENLEPNLPLFFAIKTVDDANNISEISNSTSAIPEEVQDVTPPAQITNLTAQINGDNITLNWTSVGDDNNDGTASAYDLRWSNEEISENNFSEANQISGLNSPLEAGNSEEYIFTQAETNIRYYFAIKAVDENENWSNLSNVVNILIEDTSDQIPPSQISNLVAENLENNIQLSWTAVGDDNNEGQASQYDLRYSDSIINEDNFNQATQISDVQAPAISGTPETYLFNVTNYDHIFYFAIKAKDEAGNISQLSNVVNLSIPDPSDIIAPAAITNLSVVSGNTNTLNKIRISFTATGDDNNQGIAAAYIIKYNDSEITEANWNTSTTFANSVQPQLSGYTENIDVTGLEPGHLYYFAIKAVDDSNNESEISNTPGGKLVYAINEPACHDCGNCINDCSHGAISDAGNYKTIDPDLCVGCGECSCPFGLIHKFVMAYNQPNK